MSALGFGIVGCGGAAADMAEAIAELPEAAVVCAFDAVEERTRAFAGRYGARPCSSLEELLGDGSVEAVYVGLPHHLLAPVSEQALGAGKHVLVEKPMALELEAIHELERLAAERGLVIAPVFELRAHPVAIEARRLIAGGAIGEIRMIRIRTVIDKPDSYWQSGAWRARRAESGGGVVLMNSIHQLDLIRYLTGLSFVRATAETATLHARVEVEDTAAAVLRLSNGGLVGLAVAAHSSGASGEERIEIDGSAGRLDLPDLTGEQACRLRLYLRRPWGDLEADRWFDRDLGSANIHVELVRAFASAVQTRSAPPADAADAAAALGAVLAIYRSSQVARAIDVEVG